jgi:hypothetical protein
MQTLALILVLTVYLLAGCAEFETKMEEMNQLTCKPPEASLCAGWKV